MITDEQVAEEIARLTRERDRAEQLAQHRGELLKEARRERDLAIAHDRQPYPTADAYERACAALEKHRGRADRLHGMMREVQSRLLAVSGADDLRLFVRLAIEEDRKARNESLGDVPVESAPAAEAKIADSIPLSEQAVYHLSGQHPDCKIDHAPTEGKIKDA